MSLRLENDELTEKVAELEERGDEIPKPTFSAVISTSRTVGAPIMGTKMLKSQTHGRKGRPA